MSSIICHVPSGTIYDIFFIVENDVGYLLNFARGYSWIQGTEQQSTLWIRGVGVVVLTVAPSVAGVLLIVGHVREYRMDPLSASSPRPATKDFLVSSVVGVVGA